MTASRPARRRIASLATLSLVAAAAVAYFATGQAVAEPIISITPSVVSNNATASRACTDAELAEPPPECTGFTRVTILTTSAFPTQSEPGIANATTVSLVRVNEGTTQPSGDSYSGNIVESLSGPSPTLSVPTRTRIVVDFSFNPPPASPPPPGPANPGVYNLAVSNSGARDECIRCFTVVTPTGAPTVTSLNVTQLSSGTTVAGTSQTPLTVTGTNFARGTIIQFLRDGVVDPGIVFTKISTNQATSPTQTRLTGSISTANGSVPGFRDVRATNVDFRSGTCSNCVSVSGINVTGVNPQGGSDQDVRRLTITGAGFVAESQVQLVKKFQTGQSPITGGVVSVSPPAQMIAEFDLRGVQRGVYLIQVTNPGGATNNIACSPDFTVVAAGSVATPTPEPTTSPAAVGTCTFGGFPPPSPSGSPSPPSSATPSASVTSTASASATATATPPAPSGTGRYVAINPDRTLDTRTGVGSFAAPLGPRETRSLQVTGRSGIPAGATAVTFNLTVDRPTAAGFVTAFPAGQQRPTASNINFVRGETIANLVTVSIGSGGQVSLYNASGSTELIADVVGYYGPASGGAAYSALNPERIMDSRDGNGTLSEPFGSGETRSLQVVGRANVPATATAVAFNLTAISPTAAGFLTAYPSGTIRPTASNLNFVRGDVIANLVVVRIGTGGQVSIFNNSGATDVAADIVGYFSDTGGAAALFTPIAPERFLDTRDGTGGLRQPIGPSESRGLQITGRGGIPANATAVTFNLTAVQPSSSGFFTAYPSGTIRPNASNVNFVRGDVIANLVIVRVGNGGRVDIFNNSGFANAVVDVVGYYVAPAVASPSATATATSTSTASPTATVTPTSTVTPTVTPTAAPTSTPSMSAAAFGGSTDSPTRTTSTSALSLLVLVTFTGGVGFLIAPRLVAAVGYRRRH